MWGKRNEFYSKILKSYISFLSDLDEKDEYFSPERQKQSQKKSNEEKGTSWIHDTFTVVSIGSKWIKINNVDGYENKLLIAAAPGLKEGARYEADVKRKWIQTPYGFKVEYTDLKDLHKL